MDKAAELHTTVNQFGSLLMTDYQKSLLSDKLPKLGGAIKGYLINAFNSLLLQVPIRRASPCADFHYFMTLFLQDILDLNDIVVKTIKYSDTINDYLNEIDDLHDTLKDLIRVNDMMKPVIPQISNIPYIGPFARVFQTNFNTLITNPVTPVKKQFDSFVNKIKQYKIKERNNQFISGATNVSDIIYTFIQDATIYSDALIAVDKVALWKPTTTDNGQLTYNYTLTAQTCTAINIVLKNVINEVDDVKNQMDILLGRLQLLSNLINIIDSFQKMFNAQIIGSIQSIFNILGSFLSKEISACIPWICFRDKTVCTTVSYPCGTKKCKTGFGKVPCGVKMCSDDECVSVPDPYNCQRCGSFTVQEIINGLMNTVEQIQNAIMNALESAAKALGISFPSITLPGLPGINFMAGIENFLERIFADILDVPIFNRLYKTVNSVRRKLREIEALVPPSE